MRLLDLFSQAFYLMSFHNLMVIFLELFACKEHLGIMPFLDFFSEQFFSIRFFIIFGAFVYIYSFRKKLIQFFSYFCKQHCLIDILTLRLRLGEQVT